MIPAWACADALVSSGCSRQWRRRWSCGSAEPSRRRPGYRGSRRRSRRCGASRGRLPGHPKGASTRSIASRRLVNRTPARSAKTNCEADCCLRASSKPMAQAVGLRTRASRGYANCADAPLPSLATISPLSGNVSGRRISCERTSGQRPCVRDSKPSPNSQSDGFAASVAKRATRPVASAAGRVSSHAGVPVTGTGSALSSVD